MSRFAALQYAPERTIAESDAVRAKLIHAVEQVITDHYGKPKPHTLVTYQIHDPDDANFKLDDDPYKDWWLVRIEVEVDD